jgi:proteasome beta subunit
MEEYKGTTTIGMICKDGIILATEKRATMGHFIASQDAKKVHKIDDYIGMTIAGSVGDAQKLIKYMKMESSMYKFNHGEPITIKGLSNVLSNILNNSKSLYSVQLIIGGMDKGGFKIYSIDSAGGLIDEPKFVSTGSGSIFAYGVLETQYKDNMTLDDGLKVVVNSLRTAMKRDSASGGKIDAVMITKDGYFEVPESTILEIPS